MNVSVRQIWIVAAILAAVIAALLVNRIAMTDKQRVERVIGDMASSANDGDVSGIFSHVSADFEDENMTRDQLRMIAAGFFLTNHHVRVHVRRMTVSVSGKLARVEVSLSGESERDGARMASGVSDWTGQLRKEQDGVWRVTSIAPVRMDGSEVSGWRDISRRYF